MKRATISIFAAAVAVLSPTAFAQVQGPGGHYYKVVLEPGLLWEEAKARAAESTLNGVHGYLATITSAEEDQFIENLRIEAAPAGQNSLWVGGSQLSYATGAAEGWFWENGEGQIPTTSAQSGYSHWQTGEPNDYWGPQSESYLSIGHFNVFGWNDEPNDHNVQGYVIEYPSAGTITTVRVTATDPIAIEQSDPLFPGITAQNEVATFTFSRNGDLTLDLPVFYSVHGTAVNGGDYNEIPKSLIIPAGKSEIQLRIVPREDLLTVVEKMETVGIRLEPSQILTPSAGYRIDAENREAAAVIFERQPPERTSVEIAVPRTGFAYQDGEPVNILAFLYSNDAITTVNFYADNQLIGSASDTIHERLRFVKFAWTNPPPGTHTIVARADVALDSPPASTPMMISIPGTPQPTTVAIRFIEPTSTEPVPDADYAPGYFAVVRDIGDTAHDLQVFYSISGTATARVDYEELQGYVVIPAGKTGAKIVVSAKDDALDEPNETVILTLVPAPANAANPIDDGSVYNIDPNYKTAQIVILDNDDPGPAFLVSIAATHGETIENGTSTGTFRIAREGGSVTEPMTVFLQYSGTATPGEDYLKLPESVVIPAGAFSVEVEVRPLDDQLIEGVETVIATLTPLRGVLYNIAPNANTATVRIVDNEIAPAERVVRIEAIDPVATESQPDGGPASDAASFLVSRLGDLTRDLVVAYSIHGTAKNGDDYLTLSGTVTIPATKPSAEIRIVPVSDTPSIGHKYEVVPESGVTWTQARERAAQKTYLNSVGHLATITSAEEDAKVEALRIANGSLVLWVGGYQEPTETRVTEGWKWDNNDGLIPGVNGSADGYSNWQQGEPNDYWGGASENAMVIGWLNAFGWNDQGANVSTGGYVVEYDVEEVSPQSREIMETVGIRLEASPTMNPLPAYKIDETRRSAVAVIFDGQVPDGGALEIAIPSSGDAYASAPVEFLAAAFHPTTTIYTVDFFVDDVKVGTSSLDTSPITTAGGVIAHRFKWASPITGQHVLQAKATLGGGRVLQSSRIPFTVQGVNAAPTVKVTRPLDGATFLETDAIAIRAQASDSDGTIMKLEVLLDGNVIGTNAGAVLELSYEAEAGEHVLTARATDNAGAVGLSAPVHILVRHPEAVAFVHRELPAAYSPGVSFVVELRADPPEGTFAYAVEDRPPTGWLVSEISDDGAFDAINGKVKFGPFLDDSARTLKYRVTPPPSATGSFEFAGSSSVNGATYPITGDMRIELARQYHPADTNQDFRIVLSEVTAYAAAWKAGQSWPTGPVPIPLNYATRAHHIWQRGETYRFDPAAGAAPACWVTTSGGAGASLATAGVATRSMFGDMRADAATQVRISATPPTGSSGYAVEERPPYGWMISNISHEGVFDAAAGVIRWGVFSDGVARTLSYSATPPPAVSSIGVFAGQLSYDGKLLLIGADSRFENSVSIDGAAPVRMTCEPAPTGFKLNITGPSGQTGVIESSTDFSDWTEVKSIFIPNGAVEVTDESPASERRFYRLRVQ